MKLSHLQKFAVVSAVALTIASAHMAQAVEIGDVVPVGVGALVNNAIVVSVADLDFGTIGAMGDQSTTPTGSTATMLVETTADFAGGAAAAGTDFTDDPGNGVNGTDPAAIVSDPGAGPTAALITVTGFADVDFYVTYDNLQQLDGATGGQHFSLDEVHDDLLTTGGTCTATCISGSWDGTNRVIGIGHTDATTGDLTFHIGGTITTDPTQQVAYKSEQYTGSFDMIFSY